MESIIRPFSAEELTALSLLAQRLNARRETGSSFCCANAEDIRRDFEETISYSFACWKGQQPLGLISCFPDFAKGNADCSLLINAAGETYQTIAKALLASAQAKINPGLSEAGQSHSIQNATLTFFFPTENKDCRNFLISIGARQQVNEYLLLLTRETWHASAHDRSEPRPIKNDEHHAFAALHDQIFPGVYASGADILADLGKTRFVSVIADEQGLAAYGVLKFRDDTQAVAEMIGVRMDARRRGYGRAILHELARQAFSRFETVSLELVVEADNVNALTLYLHTGFCLRQENHCFIL